MWLLDIFAVSNPVSIYFFCAFYLGAAILANALGIGDVMGNVIDY
jgi:hypothetical protein